MTDKEKLKGIKTLCRLPNKEKDFGNGWKAYALTLEQRLKTIEKASQKDKQLEFPDLRLPTLLKGENIKLDHTKPILNGRYVCTDCGTNLIDFEDPCPDCMATSSK